MDITAVGVDLAKHVFQVHAVDARGHIVCRKRLSRSQMAPFFARLSPCLVGMEACGSAHYWARRLTAMGQSVKLMAPHFVKPYVKTNKNDMNDAEAICEAVQRPNMRFVAVKTVEQQSILHLHVSRQLLVKMRTQVSNHLRGLLSEYGLILPQGISHLAEIPALAEDATNGLPGMLRQLLMDMLEHLREIDRKIDVMETQIRQWHRQSEASLRLAEIPGIGLLTATALVGYIGTQAQGFVNACWPASIPTRPRSRRPTEMRASSGLYSQITARTVPGSRSTEQNHCRTGAQFPNSTVAQGKHA
jgi:transposase